jgi:hypothetical protein
MVVVHETAGWAVPSKAPGRFALPSGQRGGERARDVNADGECRIRRIDIAGLLVDHDATTEHLA